MVDYALHEGRSQAVYPGLWQVQAQSRQSAGIVPGVVDGHSQTLLQVL